MKNKTLLLILALALLFVLVAAALLYDDLSSKALQEQLSTAVPFTPSTSTQDDSTEDPPEDDPQKAPEFTVYDGQGRQVKLADFLGKPVILNFWASWCGPCASEMPAFEEAYEKYGDDIHFLMINSTDGSRETQETANAFIIENGYAFPVYYDTDSSAAISYNVQSLPTTYFIDSEGYAVAYANGALSEESLQKGIDMVLE